MSDPRNKLTDTELEGLARLGYDLRWIEDGVLTPDGLRAQLGTAAQPGADPNAEHYRAATLQAFLRARDRLTEDELRSVLALGEVDPDPSLRPNFAHELIRFAGLTDEQFELVARHPGDSSFQRVVTRLRLLRRLRAGGPLAEVFDEAVASGDGQVHAAVLDHDELTRAQVEVLAARGGNRAIRNRARQMLAHSTHDA